MNTYGFVLKVVIMYTLGKLEDGSKFVTRSMWFVSNIEVPISSVALHMLEVSYVNIHNVQLNSYKVRKFKKTNTF